MFSDQKPNPLLWALQKDLNLEGVAHLTLSLLHLISVLLIFLWGDAHETFFF